MHGSGGRISSMKLLGVTIGTGIVITALLIATTFLLIGAERFWRPFGDPDLGPVSFEQLERRSTPNDALASPPGLCKAVSDVIVPLYPKTAHDLRVAFSKVIASEPRVSVVELDDTTLTDRYIQRSQYLGFPDTIVVRFLDRGNGRSTLAIYSRSQLGRADLGVNRTRIERWLTKLHMSVPQID
jgi:uncharacterized protein (DUF1499 family)